MTKKFSKSTTSQKRVLDAAAKIFRNYGYAGTTMRLIAEQAELKAGSIYYHYRSKDDLISAVLDSGITLVISRVEQALADLPEDVGGRERVEAAIHAHLSAITEIGDYTLATRNVSEQIPEAIRARNLARRYSYAMLWQNILVDAQARGAFRSDASMTLARLFILGALNWTIEWFNPARRSLAEVARSFTALVIDGLATPAARTVSPPARAEAKPRAKAVADKPAPRRRVAAKTTAG